MKVVFRTDASVQIGSGHLVRCLTLAEALRSRGAEIQFVCRDLPGNLNCLVTDKGFVLSRLPASEVTTEALNWNRHAAWLEVSWQQDADETLNCLRYGETPIDWLIVDHYALDGRWESRLRATASQIMVIDDLADRQHDCDLLLDQNLYEKMEHRYSGLVPAACRLLLGPQYALLRQEFPAARQQLRARGGAVARVLVFYGGADPGNDTAKALVALQLARLENVTVDVVVGATNPNKEQLEMLCDEIPGAHFHCQVDNMAERMAAADLMLCAAGTTTWERCAMGLPALVTASALNQELVAEHSARCGLSLYLGRSADVTAERLADALRFFASAPHCLQMFAAKELAAVDAKGTQRVTTILLPPAVLLRRATLDDCDAVYEWRNAEETRRYIFDAEPIPLELHRRWYQATLDDPARVLLIGELDEQPVGVLRYDLSGEEALISVYLVPGIQGQGIGTQLIRTGSEWLKQNYPAIKMINAEILSVNLGSIKAFEQAGYVSHHLTYQKVLR